VAGAKEGAVLDYATLCHVCHSGKQYVTQSGYSIVHAEARGPTRGRIRRGNRDLPLKQLGASDPRERTGARAGSRRVALDLAPDVEPPPVRFPAHVLPRPRGLTLGKAGARRP
jgi:hypothetical protein